MMATVRAVGHRVWSASADAVTSTLSLNPATLVVPCGKPSVAGSETAQKMIGFSFSTRAAACVASVPMVAMAAMFLSLCMLCAMVCAVEIDPSAFWATHETLSPNCCLRCFSSASRALSSAGCEIVCMMPMVNSLDGCELRDLRTAIVPAMTSVPARAKTISFFIDIVVFLIFFLFFFFCLFDFIFYIIGLSICFFCIKKGPLVFEPEGLVGDAVLFFTCRYPRAYLWLNLK